MKIELTNRELNELQWFIRTVLDWKSGGPYGDGDEVTEKKGEALMEQIAKKIQSQRTSRFEGASKTNKLLQAFSEINYDEILKK